MSLDVEMLTVGPVAENCFLLRREGSDRLLVVDPGEEAERILAAVEASGAEVEAILHHPLPLRPHRRRRAGGARRPGRRSTAPRSRCRCSPTSWPSSPGRASARSRATRPTRSSSGGETLELAGLELDVIFTPGHSPGHVTYSVRGEDAIFSGDVLFQGSVGRVDLPGGDGPTLLRSIAHPARRPPRRDRRLSRPHGHRRRSAPSGRPTRSSPSWRARRGGARAGKVAAPMASKYQAPRGTFDVLPDAGARARRGSSAPPRRSSPAPATSRSRRPAFEDTELFERGVGQLDRHRPQGDVHLRGQGRAQPHPAARGHGADLPRLPRARDAQTGAAGEALLPRARSSATSARRRAATASSTSSGSRRSAPTRRSPTPR